MPRRGIAVRPAHVKRADNAFTVPVTLTFISTLQPTTTLITSSSSSQITTSSSSIISSSSSLTILPPAPSSSSFSLTTQPTATPEVSAQTPVVSALSSGTPSNMADSTNISGTRRISPGAIVGIVIGGLILILALLVVLLRNRFRRNRQQRRTTWITKGVPSQAVTGITASSFAPAEKFPETALSPGLSFAQAQRQALATRGGAISPRTALPPNVATVKFTFNPTLPDELSIVNGEVMTILQEFDDGWALCQNGSGAQGMVPLECLARVGQTPVQLGMAVGSARDVRNSKRVSSLLGAQGTIRR